MMSWNAAPLIEISSTPPSKLFSKPYWWRNVTVAPESGVNTGVTRLLSDRLFTSGANAELGGVSATALVVTHNAPEPVPVVVNPAGKAGAVTASKFQVMGAAWADSELPQNAANGSTSQVSSALLRVVFMACLLWLGLG